MTEPPRHDETTRRTVTPRPGGVEAQGTMRGAGRSREPRVRWRPLASILVLLWAIGATAAALWLWREWQAGLAAGAALGVGEPPPVEPPPDRRVLVAARFDELPGWELDHHAEALPALERTCARFAFLGAATALKPVELGGTVADWLGFCERVVALGRELDRDAAARAQGDARLKALFETELLPFQVRNHEREVGLFTGYYEPLLRGSRRRGGAYQVPLYRNPRDIVSVDLGEFREALRGQRIAGRLDGNRLVPYADRAEIEAGALAGRRLELLWVDDPVDAFFLQVQGSGQVQLEDGTRVRVGYDGQNGHPYFAIGRDLVERGALTIEQVSMQSIAAWLRSHPADAAAVTGRNASYVFFRELQGDGPIGSQGVALTPERSLAVDLAFLPLGAPLWLDTVHPPHPTEGGAAGTPSPTQDLPLQRLLVAQDTGGAIRGPVRGDVFWGAGERAASIAGRMRSEGRLWVLLPRELAARLDPELFRDE